MNIEDLVQLLNNRLREFKLSRDYAKMNGDLERMNSADKEVLSLEDTLFKLNLLIDTSKSAAVKETILAEVITDGSVAVLGEYDITSYATDPLHEEKIMNILSKMGVMDTAEKIDDYINGKYLSSPVTGEMIMSAAFAYSVDARLMMAIMEQDSRFGTVGVAVRTLNPGNMGNNDAGDTVTYESWQEGVTAVAGWLSRHRGSTTVSEILDTLTSIPPVTTSTPSIIIPTTTTTTSTTIFTPTIDTATSTPTIATTTPAVVTSTSSGQATSTPEIIPVTTSTTTTSTATSTPTSTPTSTTSQPEAGPPLAETPEIIPVTTSTTTTSTATSTPTSTPTTTTSQPEAGPPLAETPEIIPVTTSTTTTTSTPITDATSTPVTATSTTTTSTATSTE